MTTPVKTIHIKRTSIGQVAIMVQDMDPDYRYVQLFDQHVKVVQDDVILWFLIEGAKLSTATIMRMAREYVGGKWQLEKWNLKEMTVTFPNGIVKGGYRRGV